VSTTRSSLNLTFLGGGGHAKVVFDAAICAGVVLAGFVDDDPRASITELDGCPPWVGPFDEFPERQSTTSSACLITIGDLRARRQIIDKNMYAFGSLIHPSAVVSVHAQIGDGVFIGPGAIVNAGARVGDHAIVNSGAIVEHDCVVGINTHIAPGSVVGGGAIIGDDTLVGIGSRVLPGVRVESGCTIGAGSVVIECIENGATVVGVPARVVDLVV
jgi:sugar O-acyltransferase (sialic acid O-acetyltransferase NeuD family)